MLFTVALLGGFALLYVVSLTQSSDSNANELEDRVESLEGEVHHLESQVSDLETRLDDLERELLLLRLNVR